MFCDELQHGEVPLLVESPLDPLVTAPPQMHPKSLQLSRSPDWLSRCSVTSSPFAHAISGPELVSFHTNKMSVAGAWRFIKEGGSEAIAVAQVQVLCPTMLILR